MARGTLLLRIEGESDGKVRRSDETVLLDLRLSRHPDRTVLCLCSFPYFFLFRHMQAAGHLFFSQKACPFLCLPSRYPRSFAGHYSCLHSRAVGHICFLLVESFRLVLLNNAIVFSVVNASRVAFGNDVRFELQSLWAIQASVPKSHIPTAHTGPASELQQQITNAHRLKYEFEFKRNTKIMEQEI